MKSRQQKAKEAQGFCKSRNRLYCETCEHFTRDFVEKYGCTNETNLRCAIGNFKVGKKDICSEHKPLAGNQE